MANVKISDLPAASTPLSGTELVPIVQSGVTSQTVVSNLLSEQAGSSFVGYLSSGTNAVATTVQAKLREAVSVLDFIPVGTNTATTDCYAFFNNALDQVGAGKKLFVPAGTYLLNSPLLIGGTSSRCHQLVGESIDYTILKFNISGHSSDCVQMSGYNFQSCVLQDCTIDAQATGLDAVALYASDRPNVTRVKISNAYRNGFAVKCNGNLYQWVENLKADNIIVNNSGLHGFYLQRPRTTSVPFFNESVFYQCEVRGVSLRAPLFGINIATQQLQLGAAVYAYDASVSSAGKMSCITWIDCNFDAERQKALNASSEINYSPMVLADATQAHVVEGAGIVGAVNRFEAWNIISGGWETTTATPYYNFLGYPLISAESTNVAAFGWNVSGIVPGGWSDSTGVFGNTNFTAAQGSGNWCNNVHNRTMNYMGDVNLIGGDTISGLNSQVSTKNSGCTQIIRSLSAPATVTMTIASPCVVTYTGHALVNGDQVVFTTTGALPTGLTAGTAYYVVNAATNTFNVSATSGGTAINTSGSQSGVHTCTPNFNVTISFPTKISSLSSQNNFMFYDLQVSYAQYAGVPTTFYQQYTSRIQTRGSFAGAITYSTLIANTYLPSAYFTVNSVTPDPANNKVTINLTTTSTYGAGGGMGETYVVLNAIGGIRDV